MAFRAFRVLWLMPRRNHIGMLPRRYRNDPRGPLVKPFKLAAVFVVLAIAVFAGVKVGMRAEHDSKLHQQADYGGNQAGPGGTAR